jgi:hypothetical protein
MPALKRSTPALSSTEAMTSTTANLTYFRLFEHTRRRCLSMLPRGPVSARDAGSDYGVENGWNLRGRALRGHNAIRTYKHHAGSISAGDLAPD